MPNDNPRKSPLIRGTVTGAWIVGLAIFLRWWEITSQAPTVLVWTAAFTLAFVGTAWWIEQDRLRDKRHPAWKRVGLWTAVVVLTVVVLAIVPEIRLAGAPVRTVAFAGDWLRARTSTAPLFLWVHVFDPHSPYRPEQPLSEPPTGRGALAAFLMREHRLSKDFFGGSEALMLELITSYDELRKNVVGGHVQYMVFAVESFLRQQEPQLPGEKVSHDWRTTSDAIAARVATVTRANELVLLKSTPLPPGTSPHTASQQGLVDERFPFVTAGIPIRWVNLRDPDQDETQLSGGYAS